METGASIVLFDGVCNLCNASVRFIIRRDRRAVFRFAPLQSPAGRRLLEGRLPSGEPAPDSVVLIEEGRAFFRSSAALRIARRLRFPWPLLALLLLIPAPLRDWVYAFIAARRHRWFGTAGDCPVPAAEIRDRFLS